MFLFSFWLRNGYKMISKLQNGCKMISKLWNGLRKSPSFAKSSPHYKNGLQASKWLRKCSKHQNGLRNSHLAGKCFRSPIATPCEITLGLQKTFFFIPFGCKMISKLQNDLQAIKMTCKMKRGLQKHFAKPREVVKMPTKPHTMHMKRRALSLRSHTWSLSFHFLPP